MAARSRDSLAEFERRYPGTALAPELDVTKPEMSRAAVEAAIAEFGRIDIVVNNAGYGLFGALEELSLDEFRDQFATNVYGSVNVLQAALPHLRRQRSGHIVQISSLEGVAPAVAGESANAGTKFAVEGIAEGVAKDIEHLGIRVTVVEPGPLRTDFARGARVRPPENEDYEPSVGAALKWFEDIAGNQPNEPHLVDAAIVAAVEASEPPLRLVLGSEAIAAVRDKLGAQLRELDAWSHLGKATATPA